MWKKKKENGFCGIIRCLLLCVRLLEARAASAAAVDGAAAEPQVRPLTHERLIAEHAHKRAFWGLHSPCASMFLQGSGQRRRRCGCSRGLRR